MQALGCRKITIALCAAVLFVCLALCAWRLAPAASGNSGVETQGAAFGMLLIDIADHETADSLHVDEWGVYVLAVQEKSPADLAGVYPGDRLLTANEQPVQDTGAFVSMQKMFLPDEHVRLGLQRQTDKRFYTVTLAWNEN